MLNAMMGYSIDTSSNRLVFSESYAEFETSDGNSVGLSPNQQDSRIFIVSGGDAGALSTDTLHISSYRSNVYTYNGAIYDFDNSHRDEIGYGMSVSIDNNVLAIGVPDLDKANQNYNQTGDIFIFDYNTSSNVWEPRLYNVNSNTDHLGIAEPFISTWSDTTNRFIGSNVVLSNSGNKLLFSEGLEKLPNTHILDWDQSTSTWSEDSAYPGSSISNPTMYYGQSVDMITRSDGTTVVAVGHPAKFDSDIPKLHIFTHDGTTWYSATAEGPSLDVGGATRLYNRYIYNVSLNHTGEYVAVGNPEASQETSHTSGYVDIYNITNHTTSPTITHKQTINAPVSLSSSGQLWGWNVKFDRTGHDFLTIGDDERAGAIYKYNNATTPYTRASLSAFEFTPHIDGSETYPSTGPARVLMGTFLSDSDYLYIGSGSPRVDASATNDGVMNIYRTDRSLTGEL